MTVVNLHGKTNEATDWAKQRQSMLDRFADMIDQLHSDMEAPTHGNLSMVAVIWGHGEESVYTQAGFDMCPMHAVHQPAYLHWASQKVAGCVTTETLEP